MEPRRDTRAAVLAGFLGWTLDAFDFFLVVMCLTAIAAEFGRPDKDVAFTLTMTLAFRPVGAFVFGLLADRYGRRLPLMLDLIFYSVVEVLSGLAPSYTTFLILRALFGIGMGGEWGVGASLVMEKVPPHKRGMFSGLLQQGYAAGYLLAALCYFFVFPRWGWRPLFFIGGLPALLALYVRLQVTESEVWKRTRHHDWSGLGRTIASHWRLFLYITLLMAGMNFASHGTQDIYPTFLKRHWGFGPGTVTALTALSMVAGSPVSIQSPAAPSLVRNRWTCMSTVRVWMSGCACHTDSSSWERDWTRSRRSIRRSSSLNSVAVSSTSFPSAVTRWAVRSRTIGPPTRRPPAATGGAERRRRIAPTRRTSSLGENGFAR